MNNHDKITVDIGQYNRLQILERTTDGLILAASDPNSHETGTESTLLLPIDEIPVGTDSSPWVQPDTDTSITKDAEVGQWLDVFIYTDASGMPIATTRTPLVTVGEFALLDVVSTTPAGIWLDWGMPRDLLLPRSEIQRNESEKRANRAPVFVYVFVDTDTQRLCATTRFHRHFSEDGSGLRAWQKVSLIVAGKSAMGYKAIIDQQYLGLLYADEVFQPLDEGDRLEGYIKSVRADGKIDLTLYARPDVLKDELGERILSDLKARGGESQLTDKSQPEEIYQLFQVSKKNYKRALGNLYKARLIRIEPGRIVLVDESHP